MVTAYGCVGTYATPPHPYLPQKPWEAVRSNTSMLDRVRDDPDEGATGVY